MNPNEHFFQAFFGPQNMQSGPQIPEYIIHNDVVLEIINNWTFVHNLIDKYKTGKLQKVDQLEQTWYNFIIGKNIDIKSYKNEEEFFNAHWIIPAN